MMFAGRWIIAATLAASSTVAFGCSCVSRDGAEGRRIDAETAKSVDVVIAGSIIAETTVPAMPSALSRACPATPLWRIVRVDRVIDQRRGGIGSSASPVAITVAVRGDAAMDCDMISSCDVRPTAGERGVFALQQSPDGTLTFSSWCATAAARRHWKDHAIGGR